MRKFVHAAYPAEAAAAGLDGVVVLKLDIDTSGHVTDVAVAESAGHGFDAAASEAARQFEFEPASRDGVPVRARILYRYKFTLSSAEPSAAPAGGGSSGGGAPGASQQEGAGSASAAEASSRGELRGVVVAGHPPRPVAGAHVRIRSEAMSALELTATGEGTFAASGLRAGRYTVEIMADGFDPVESTEEVVAGTVSSIRYELAAIASPLEVLVRGAPAQREVSRYAMTRRELARIPGTMGDAIGAVQALPGVGRPAAFSGNLIVRGAHPADTQVFIDGTYVPRVFHYAGLSSVVPTEMIERLELYPSNFSVRFGRGNGAVVDVALRKTNQDGKFHGSAQVDFINARANAEGPVPGLPGWNFMAGGRASYVHTWLIPVLRSSGSGIDAMPQYYDYQAYLEKDLGQGAYCRFGVFGAIDRYLPIQKNDDETDFPRDSFGNLQALLRFPIAKGLRWDSTLSAGYSHERSAGYEERQTTTDVKLAIARSELSWTVPAWGSLRLGGDVQYAPFDVHTKTEQKAQGGKLAYAPTGTSTLRELDLHGHYFRPAAFLEVEATPHARIQSVFGVRVDYARDTDRWDIAPRWTGRANLVSGPLKTTIKAGAGVFFQPPQPRTTLPEVGTASLRSERAVHGMVGVEQGLTDSVELSVEGFAKDLSGLLSYRTSDDGVPTIVNSGSGYVVGVDALLRYRPDSRFFGWIAYTLSRSMRRVDADRPLVLDAYDQPHILNVVGSYRLGRGWELGGRFRFISGFVRSSCYGGMFNNAWGGYYCYGPAERERLGAFHQLDLRVEKTWQYVSWKWSFYADLMNVYYHKSPDYMVPDFDFSRMQPKSMSLPVLPSLGLRGEF